MAEKATTEDKIPKALRSRPVLTQYQKEYWEAYRALASSRQFTSSGIAEIPYSEKILWLDENEIWDRDMRRDFMQMITMLDGVYTEDFYKKQKQRMSNV